MERKFYEQGFGLKPVMTKMSIPPMKKEKNAYVKMTKNYTEHKRGFQVKKVENPEATKRVYNLG